MRLTIQEQETDAFASGGHNLLMACEIGWPQRRMRGIGMNEFSSCTKCAFEATDPVTFCRQCGGKMITSARIRKLGQFSVVVGAFLVVMMLLVIFFEARAMLPGSDTHYTGTHVQALLMFLLEGAVVAFGVVSIVAGLWQIKHGKRNKKLVYLAIALAILIVLLCFAFIKASPESGD